MKKSVKYIGITLAAALMSSGLFAFDLSTESSFAFTGGWRQDHLRSSATTNIDESTDIVRGSHLNIWQIGVKGWVSPCLSSCDPWLNNFFVRGCAHWGWVSDGIYSHRFEPAPDTTETVVRGDISHGHTWDYSIGGGYLFGCDNGIKIGPTGGYSWNKLTYKAENVMGVINTFDTSTALDTLSYFDEGALFSSKWMGPWVGVDAAWECNNFLVIASYEYHWARWKGGFHSPSTDLDDNIHFSDSRSGRNGWGHVAYLGATYTLSDCWKLGANVKYNYFHVRGSLSPTAVGGFPAVGGTADESDRATTTWSSVALSVDIGYLF